MPSSSAAALAQSIDLAGVPLKKATRAIMRMALLRAGAAPISVTNGYSFDIYTPNRLMPSATKLELTYFMPRNQPIGNNKLVSARYTIPVQNRNTFDSLVAIFANKYFKPKETKKDRDGLYYTAWLLKDENIIEITYYKSDFLINLEAKNIQIYALAKLQQAIDQRLFQQNNH